MKKILTSKAGRLIFSRVARNIEKDTFESPEGEYDLKKIWQDGSLDLTEKIFATMGIICSLVKAAEVIL